MDGQPSLSGRTLDVDFEILRNYNLRQERRRLWRENFGVSSTLPVRVPEGQLLGVDESTYRDYRRGLDSACADVVICSRNDAGIPVALLTKRAKPPFNGMWWIQGGAMQSYRHSQDFVRDRARRECGVEPLIEALVGIFRTCAEDALASTLNVCYVGWVSPQDLATHRPVADRDHSSWRLFTLEEYVALPETQRHPYIDVVVRLALTTMPEETR